MHEVPEAKPAILLAWADNSADLAAIKGAGQVTELPDNPHFWYWSISWFSSWSCHVLIGLKFCVGLALVGLGLSLGLRRIFTETLQASPDYSVTISLEYAQDFWQNALASPIYRLLGF